LLQLDSERTELDSVDVGDDSWRGRRATPLDFGRDRGAAISANVLDRLTRKVSKYEVGWRERDENTGETVLVCGNGIAWSDSDVEDANRFVLEYHAVMLRCCGERKIPLKEIFLRERVAGSGTSEQENECCNGVPHVRPPRRLEAV
jgi:hypothetical protein